jgi:hemerythrin-like domain-containing protein
MATTSGGRCPGSARTPVQITAGAAGRAAVRQPRLGQVHTAEGPLDLSAMFVMHHGFRRDLRDLALAVPATPPADAEVWAALARRWKGFATALHHHHRVDDVSVWPPLLDRVQAAGDQAARTTLEAMQAEHALLDPLVERCAEGFRAMGSAPDAGTRDRLAADVIRTREVLLDHLAHEETAALPLAQQYLSVAAWKDAETAARKEFGIAGLGFAVPWSVLEIPRDQLEIALAHGGPMIRAILALTRRRFEREHRVAFRHLTCAEPV